MNITQTKTDDVAVFFDFENIVYALRNGYNVNANFEDIMDHCKEYGRVVVAHVFADWNRHSPSMITALMSNGFDPVYVPSFYTDEGGEKTLRKNAVDMYMAIDAMDTLHNRKSVDTFILLTGDSDFLPLVNAIRREGNKVLALGVDGAVSSNLAQAVDEFTFYSQVSDIPSNKLKTRPKDIYEGLVQSVKRLQKQRKSALLPNVKMMMAELLGGFDEKKHADSKGRRFQKFKEFVQEAEKRGMVQLHSTGTVNEIFLPDQEITSSRSDKDRDRSDKDKRGRDRDRDKDKDKDREKEKSKEVEKAAAPAASSNNRMTLDTGFALLVDAVNTAVQQNKSLRASSIKGIMSDKSSGFDEKSLEMPEGQEPFQRFSEFTAAAAANGLVMIKGESTRQEVHPVEGAAVPATIEAGEAKEAREANSEITTDTSAGQDTADTAELPEDFNDRQLILEALHTFSNYPASFLQVESYCRSLRNRKKVNLSSTQIRSLMTTATRTLHLLKKVSPPGSSPSMYAFEADTGKIAEFLGVSVAQLPNHVTIEGLAIEPAAEVTPAPVIELETEAAAADAETQTEEAVEIEIPIPAVEELVPEAGVNGVVPEAEAGAAVAEIEEALETPADALETPAVEEETSAEDPPATEAVTAVEAVAEAEKEKEAEVEVEAEAVSEAEETKLNLDQAYRLLISVVAAATEEERSRKLRSIKTQMVKQNDAFNEGDLINRKGKPFKRFIDFIRHAEADGLVIVTGKGAQAEISLVE
ncbi:MAG: NYN domain-containing protein [Chloroflexota bacterium]